MWVWSKLSSVKWTDAWEERFHGNANAVISELKGGKSIRVEVYCENEQGAKAIKEQFGGSVRRLVQQNWAALAPPKTGPILIRDRFVISMVEEDREKLLMKYPGRHVITIPAEMAFGTGDHPTTSTCLRYLVDEAAKQAPGWSFLDLGTGTGVLAVAAKLLEAGPVAAFDFDAMAVKVAKENTRRNGVSDVEIFEADVFTWKNRKRFDVVAANLFSTVLIEVLPRFIAWIRRGGFLILSGILYEQWAEVLAKAEECGFVLREHKKKGKWVTATFDVP